MREIRFVTLLFSVLLAAACDTLIPALHTSPTKTIPNQNNPSSTVWSVAINSSGDKLAAAYGSLLDDYVIRLWDLHQPVSTPTTLQGHTSYVKAVAFSPDGHTLASASADATVRIWNMGEPTSAPLVVRGGEHNDAFEAVAFYPDGNSLAAGGGVDKTVYLWSLIDPRKAPITLPGGEYSGSRILFTADGSMLIAGEAETVRIWKLHDYNEKPYIIQPNIGAIKAVALTSDNSFLAMGGVNGQISIWGINTESEPEFVTELSGDSKTVWALAFSPDGKLLASSGVGATIRLWGFDQQWSSLNTVRDHISTVYSIAFSPDGQTLISGGSDGAIKLWSISTLSTIRILTPP